MVAVAIYSGVINRDEPLTEYVRILIQKWKDDGHPLNQLAIKAGVSTSFPTQVLNRDTGVSSRSVTGFARAFGMKAQELKSAAYKWWLAEGQHIAADSPAAESSPERAKAIEAVLQMTNRTEDEVRRAAARFSSREFRDRPATWWANMILAELEFERGKALDREVQGKRRRKAKVELRRLAKEEAAPPKSASR